MVGKLARGRGFTLLLEALRFVLQWLGISQVIKWVIIPLILVLIISVLAALGRLYRDAEMDVLMASGVSRLRIVVREQEEA